MLKIFKNGRIITMDRNLKLAEALLVKGEYIADLGRDSYIEGRYGEQAGEIIDLEGRTVVPGFNDAHLHLYQYARAKKIVDLSHVRSLADIEKRVGDYCRERSPEADAWIEGKGWNDAEFNRQQIPDRTDLDRINSSNPMILIRACYHMAVVNTRALELARIGRDTADPEGGQIGRDREGYPNGILYDNAMGLVKNIIPSQEISGIKETLKEGLRDALAVGLTSLQTDDFITTGPPGLVLEAYRQLAREGELPLRVTLQLRISTPEEVDWLREETDRLREEFKSQPSPYLKAGPVKLFADGSLGARTAALLEPYQDSPQDSPARGSYLLSQERLNELVLTAHKKGFQLAVHAIGDGALDRVLSSYEYMQANYPREDARPIVVHTQVGNTTLYRRMKELGVVAAIQPIFLPTDWPIVEKRLGPERAAESYAWKTLLRTGITAAGSSDCPIEPFNPLYGIYAAVTREDFQGRPRGGWQPEEKLSITEALALFTRNAAYQSFEEEIKGSLAPGKLADFVILSEDIGSSPPERIKDIAVEATYVGGSLAWSSNTLL